MVLFAPPALMKVYPVASTNSKTVASAPKTSMAQSRPSNCLESPSKSVNCVAASATDGKAAKGPLITISAT
ncbi:hypothetical protein CAC42_7029 [Sphaceloma murrayae]|uniref:Uncharacterized protein n=1 Tax=Sphaceloma murrayae TaxID=2082308 RepID=A0A2K1QQH3_9PEZI|nr:hypothetical protein CAC42_7029 [Sphaceloma murrayae]